MLRTISAIASRYRCRSFAQFYFCADLLQPGCQEFDLSLLLRHGGLKLLLLLDYRLLFRHARL